MSAHVQHYPLFKYILISDISQFQLGDIRLRDHSRPQRPRSFWSAPRIVTSGPVNDIPFLNGFVNTIDWDHNQSDLSDLNLNMRRVTGSPWIADFRCWTWPEVHSGQTTGHFREHARDSSPSGHFPSTSHKISTVNLRPRAISVLSSIILPLQTFFSRVLLLRQQPFSSENLPPERPTTTIAIKTCFATNS